jgi:hypothetical protein
MDKNSLVKEIHNILKSYNFKRKGNRWTLKLEEIEKIFELQKSYYSKLYYINYGFNFNNVYDDGLTMQLFLRLSHKEYLINERIKELEDFENSIDDKTRIDELIHFINDIIISKFNEIKNEKGLIHFVNNEYNQNMIPITVKKYLKDN